MKLNLNSLLEFYKFPLPLSKTVKLVYHSTTNADIREALRNGDQELFMAYQRLQGKNVFNSCSHIVSFVPVQRASNHAIFAGIFKILQSDTPLSCPSEIIGMVLEKEWKSGLYWYDLQKTDYMEELIGRLIIDWGKSARSWHQWLTMTKPKEIIEIRPRGFSEEFPGFDELCIKYREIQRIVNDPDGYKEWHTALSSVAGVYLITDLKNGGQYVGSAYGENGFLGRWAIYAKKWHGNNKKLQKVISEQDSPFLQFSILYTCSKSKSKKYICEYEAHFKRKLGSRAHGLNGN